MKFALLWSLLIIADVSGRSFMDDPTIFAATSIRSARIASGSIGIKASNRHRPKPGGRFHGPVIVDGIPSGDISVTVEQAQSPYAAPPAKERKGRIYIPPRWVQGEYGVEVLEPGRWIELDVAREP
jgi:hypothetical protein